MGRVLSLWCKNVKCELINQDMTIDDLAGEIGKSREYTSAVVNGRVRAEPAIKAISDVLNIPDSGITATGSLIISRKCENEHREGSHEGE